MIFVLMTGSMTDPERDKFQRIYDLYASFIYRVALRELSEPELAQDCTQAAFERLIRYMDRLQEPDSPQTKSYVYRITVSVASNMRRREEKYVTKQDDELFYLIDRQKSRNSPAERAETSELLSFLEKQLTAEEKILLTCRLDGSGSYRQASEILGISEAACRKRMQRIREKLSSALKVEQNWKARLGAGKQGR